MWVPKNMIDIRMALTPSSTNHLNQRRYKSLKRSNRIWWSSRNYLRSWWTRTLRTSHLATTWICIIRLSHLGLALLARYSHFHKTIYLVSKIQIPAMVKLTKLIHRFWINSYRTNSNSSFRNNGYSWWSNSWVRTSSSSKAGAIKWIPKRFNNHWESIKYKFKIWRLN